MYVFAMLRRRPLRMHIALFPVIKWCHLKRKASRVTKQNCTFSLFIHIIIRMNHSHILKITCILSPKLITEITNGTWLLISVYQSECITYSVFNIITTTKPCLGFL